jgi:hypothetical protein
MENHSKYGDTIYFHDSDSLYVNLFIASELNWADKGLTVRQKTEFPQKDTTQLKFECVKPVELTVKVRYPSWASGDATFTLNDKKLETRGVPGSYISVKRTWQDGDRLEVRLPMSLRVETLPNDKTTVAVLYGPIVLAGQLGTEGIYGDYAQGQLDFANVPTPPVPAFITSDGDVLSHLEGVEGKILTFQTKGLGQPADVTLMPFYQTHHQRYSVYWKVYSPKEWEQKQAELAATEAKCRERLARTVDIVHPGQQQSETDHNLQGEKTESGNFRESKWRHALNGGWFSWDMKITPDTPLVLSCLYWGSDVGRIFDVLVDGHKIATQTLNKNKPDELFEIEYPLPPDMLKDKTKITVKFQAPQDGFAGGVFECGIYRPAKP